MRASFPFTRGRLILPPVEIGHEFRAEPKMALDTGARISVITPRLAEEVGLTPDESAPRGKVVGATGTAPAALLRIGSVSIMSIEVRNVRAICHPLPQELRLDGILGLDFLRHFDVEISNTTETVTMERRRA
jgi:predicted aspartyl protease